jgi:hypothetical protein
LGIFVDLLMGPSRFVLFFLLYTQYVDHYLSNAKFIVQRFFYFHLKRQTTTKGKQKENDIEKFFFKFNFLQNYLLTVESGISYFFRFVRYLSMPELQKFIRIVH